MCATKHFWGSVRVILPTKTAIKKISDNRKLEVSAAKNFFGGGSIGVIWASDGGYCMEKKVYKVEKFSNIRSVSMQNAYFVHYAAFIKLKNLIFSKYCSNFTQTCLSYLYSLLQTLKPSASQENV